MVVALVGSSLFQVPRVVARLREPGHEEGFRRIARHTTGERLAINPDMAAVDRVLALLPVPGAVDVVPFLESRLLVAGFTIRPESDFNGLLLSHLRLLFPATPMLVVAIRRDGSWRVPHGEDEIRAGDLVYFAMDPGEMENVLALLGVHRGVERRVMIAGASRIGVALAGRLEAEDVPVTLLDARHPACEKAAAVLGVGGLFGGFVGARFATMLDPEVLRRLFGIFVLVSGLRVGVSALRSAVVSRHST